MNVIKFLSKPADVVFFGTMLTIILITAPYIHYLINPPQQIDETVYHGLVEIWNTQGIKAVLDEHDNKPLMFIWIQKVLDGDYIKTRMLNIALIILNTAIIFHLTKRHEAFLYPIIPLFLNSFWLTVETVETFFILLGFALSKYQGVFVGLAALNRPYAAIYALLERRTHIVHTLTIGALYLLLLYFVGGFSYFTTLYHYGTQSGKIAGTDLIALFFLVPMFITCIYNKKMMKWGLLACVPLTIRMFAHYFITPYSLFFLGYLESKGKH